MIRWSGNVRTRLLALVAFCIATGALLRLVYPTEIEYQGDEAYMFEAATTVGRSAPWPELGMPSSREVKNPGMSIWVFVLLARAFSATTPVELSRAVALVNVFALLLLPLLALRFVKEEKDREVWLYATAFAAVNPFLVLIERKIWAQSVLPLPCVLLLMGWFARRRWFGAFVWGLAGAVAAQIHMAGFFFVPALFLFTYFADRKSSNWLGWFSGSVLGSVPMIPWLLYLRHLPPRTRAMGHDHGFEFYRYFAVDPSGLGSDYVLGSDYFDFLRFPIVASHPTYLVGALHAALLALSAWFLFLFAQDLVGSRREWRKKIRAEGDDTGLLLNAVILGMGGLMTISTIPLFRHYMMMTFPLQYVWVSRVSLRAKFGKGLLLTLIVGNMLVSASLLHYLHAHGGAPPGDLKRSYRLQLEAADRARVTPSL